MYIGTSIAVNCLPATSGKLTIESCFSLPYIFAKMMAWKSIYKKKKFFCIFTSGRFCFTCWSASQAHFPGGSRMIREVSRMLIWPQIKQKRNTDAYNMSHIMRKPVFLWGCNQERLKLACSATETS